jgi:aspartate/glutamate racemase
LGTKYLINDGFYAKALNEKYGVEVIIPNEEDIEMIF